MSNSASRKWIRPKPLDTTAARLSDSEARLSPEFNSDLDEAATVGRLYPRELSLSELFEAQAACTPEAIALRFEDTALSYRELNERANQLAHYLQRTGVGPEVLVGILIDRSVEMIVAVLAILKAGGAYVPVDPAYPFERLSFMVHDSGLRMLLTQERLSEVPGGYTGATLSLTEQWESIAGESIANLMSRAQPANVAYVIYTSGSTGRPKGVLVSHENVVRLLEATQSHFEFNQSDVWTLFHSYAFDFSVWEIWGALAYGGKLVIVPYWISRSAEAFHRLLVSEQVTVLNQTPSAFRQLIAADELNGEDVELQLRLVIFGGEALEVQTLRPWFARHGDDIPRLVNMYGITETTVHVTYHPLTAADLELPSSSVIGRPLECLQVYLLDERGQLVPIGVPGEICVGGTGLARGYLNRAELTSERFVPNPFATVPGARLYRSGDRARYLETGDIEYLGRIDQQVKVRGFRIELGEIEAVLASHPGLHEAVVVVKKDKSGAERLVAYMVGEGEEAVGKVLRGYLRERLPEFMMPQAFVSLSSLPLTPNGKVDRRALQGLEVEFESSGDQSVMARTPVEEILSGIWAEVLECETVSVYDSFLELGGHSLLATQVISRIRDVFGQELTLRTLFENPTVASLARTIEGGQSIVSGPKTPPIVRIERTGRAPASFAQQVLWFLHQWQPGKVFYNFPAVTTLTGTLNFKALVSALTAMTQRHEVLRTTFTSVDGELWQIISPAESFDLPLIDLSEIPDKARETETRRLISEEAGQPFDLARGPLMRGKLLRWSAEEHVALLTMHPIVLDVWSISIFLREVAALYRAFHEGQPSPLGALQVQYADFAHWQQQWFQGQVFEQLLHYWRQQLAGAPAALELKGKKPAPTVLTFRDAKQSIALSKELVKKLRELGRQTGVTLFMSLLAAFDVLLYRYSGQSDLLVGTPIANRNQLETQGLIGLFINTLVLRIDLSGDPTFIEVLQRVREVCLEAYAHQELQFVKLVEELQADRSQSHSPLFQVMFVMGYVEIDKLELPGLSLSVHHVENRTANVDLLLTMWETNDGMSGFLKYNTDIFDDSTIAKMVKHFQTLIENLVTDPQQHLSDSSFLTEDETMGLTSADFPESGLSQKDFESLILQLNSSSSLK